MYVPPLSGPLSTSCRRLSGVEFTVVVHLSADCAIAIQLRLKIFLDRPLKLMLDLVRVTRPLFVRVTECYTSLHFVLGGQRPRLTFSAIIVR